MAKQASTLPQVILPTFDVAMNDAARRHLDSVRQMAINSDADYEAMGQTLKVATARERMAEDGLAQHVTPLTNAVKQIRALWAPSIADYATAKSIAKKLMSEWLGKKAAEQRRLQQIADEKAAAERRRLEVRAAKAEDSGNVEKASALAHQAALTVAPSVRTEPPKIAGQSVREHWLFAIEDASLIPRQYLTPDESKIRRFVNAMKADAVIAGVRIWSEKRIASGV